jgi:hypothetical protein
MFGICIGVNYVLCSNFFSNFTLWLCLCLCTGLLYNKLCRAVKYVGDTVAS